LIELILIFVMMSFAVNSAKESLSFNILRMSPSVMIQSLYRVL
jgi:hypothetical protein